jgi:hypothetical protein
MAYCNFYLLVLLLQSLPVSAQYVVSSTAAWSSQIIAFWGAIIIAAHVGKVASAGTALFSSVRMALRIRSMTNALARGNWFLHAGWVTNKVRTDIAMVCWRTPEDLQGLVRRVAMQIETFAAGRDWQVLVVGCQLKDESSQETTVHWIKCPRNESLCGAKVKETNENLFPLQEADLAFALDMLERSRRRQRRKSCERWRRRWMCARHGVRISRSSNRNCRLRRPHSLGGGYSPAWTISSHRS